MVKQKVYKISDIKSEEIKDSRGTPTIKVTVFCKGVSGSFAVPSGASRGAHEAWVVENSRAIFNVNEIISKALVGKNVQNQKEIDDILIKLDGTKNKERLGGNAMIGVSVACAKVAAKVSNKETYQYLRTLEDIKPSRKVPYLYINLINGGKHAKSGPAFQEYHIVPITNDVGEAVEIGIKIQNSLKEIISAKFGEEFPVFGDEGGYALKTADIKEPLLLLSKAVAKNNFKGKVRLALDVAASSFYESGFYKIGDENVSKEKLMEIYTSLIKEFNLLSIEDPFDEEDFESFKKLQEENQEILVVGDDLTVTNPARLGEAIQHRSINAIIIKPNQVGTLSETLETMRTARDNNIECIVSHRSGETEDDFIADLAYAFGCSGLKAGAPQRRERLAKYNRLRHIAAMNHASQSLTPKHSRAQIIATIGPASRKVEILSQMISHQMDVARLNFSWGTYEEHAEYIRNIRQAAEMNGRRIPIIQDLSGPRIQKEKGHGFNEAAIEVITEKDLRDLNFGISQRVEYVAMSYVGDAKDIIKLRDIILEKAGHLIPIIAKVERKKALENLDEIIAVADAIMVARGDLGEAIPIEQIPFIQKEIIQKARKAKKPVITATQMLLSMVESPEPTRAEVSDVSDAISEGSDAVMLSEETASGKYPVETVTIMERIVLEAEKHGRGKKIRQL